MFPVRELQVRLTPGGPSGPLFGLPLDKVQHFLGGALIVVLAAAVGVPHDLAFLAACLVGLFKELWDWASRRGTPDSNDLVATVLGGLSGYLLLLAF